MAFEHSSEHKGSPEQHSGLFHELLDGMDSAIIVAHCEGQVVYANRLAKQWLGISEEQTAQPALSQLMTLPTDPVVPGTSGTARIHPLGQDDSIAVNVTPVCLNNPELLALSFRPAEAEPAHTPDKKTLLQQHVLSTISQAQTSFIQRNNSSFVFDFLLPDVLELSDSEFGFIAGLKRTANGKYSGQVYTNREFPWATITGSVSAPDDDSVLEIHDLHPLLQEAIDRDEPYTSNHCAVLSEKLFNNHRQTIRSLLVVPVWGYEGPIGLLVTANGKANFTRDTVDILQPITGACSSFLRATEELQKRRASKTQLIEEKLAAENAAKVKSEFLATMSHELRTPLNGLLGMLHFLQKTLTSEKQMFYARNCLSSGEILHAIINDILDFSKIEAGQIELENKPFSPQDLVQKIKGLYALSAEQKQLTFTCCCTTPGMIAIGDPTRLFQIIANLVTNAIKFTAKGSVVLEIKALSNGLNIRVADSGIGIPEAHQQRLFEPFTQADSSHSRRYGGTGLGLAITQRLTHAMSGSIRINSTPGEGTEFLIHLPLTTLHYAKNPEKLSQRLGRVIVTVLHKSTDSLNTLCQQMRDWGVRDLERVSSIAACEQRLAESVTLKQPPLLVCQRTEAIHALLEQPPSGQNASSCPHVLWLPETGSDLPGTPCPKVESSAKLDKLDDAGTLLQALDDLFGHDSEPAESQPEETANPHFDRQKILLAEDNPINQLVAMGLLQEVGFEVDIKENGKDAVSAAIENDYDLILMDIQMPQMDGLEAARAIRSMGGRLKQLPIIAMTANASTEDIENSRKAGMDAHITKPLNVQTMIATIASFIAPGEQRAHTPTYNEAQQQPATTFGIPGINMEDGLCRINGNLSAYERILGNFASLYTTFSEDLNPLITAENWTDARTLTHTLKGSSGNIGAEALYYLAADAEQHCREQNKNELLMILPELMQELQRVITGINHYLANTRNDEPAGSSETLSDTELSLAIEGILEALGRDIAESESLLEKLCAAKLSSDTRATLLEARENLLCFNIKHVKAQMTQLLNSHK